MSDKNACKGNIGTAERLAERSAFEKNPQLMMDALNLIYGPGVSKADGAKAIAALNACNDQRRAEDPNLPKIHINLDK